MRRVGGLRGLYVLICAALAHVDEREQHEHRREQQRRDGVDLRADALFRHAVDRHCQRRGTGAGGKVADDEVVDRHREGRERAGDDAGLDLGNHDAPERLHPRAAEILRRVDEVAVHLAQLRPDGEDDVRNVEADVRQQQRAEAHRQPLRQDDERLPRVHPPGKRTPAVEEHHKQQAQTHARDNIGVHHGDVVHSHEHAALFAAHGVEPDGGKRARKGRDHRREE